MHSGITSTIKSWNSLKTAVYTVRIFKRYKTLLLH